MTPTHPMLKTLEAAKEALEQRKDYEAVAALRDLTALIEQVKGQEPKLWCVTYCGEYTKNVYDFEAAALDCKQRLDISHPYGPRTVVGLFPHPAAPKFDSAPEKAGEHQTAIKPAVDVDARQAWIEKAMELATDFGMESFWVGSYERRDTIFNNGRYTLQTVKIREKRERARAALRLHLEKK